MKGIEKLSRLLDTKNKPDEESDEEKRKLQGDKEQLPTVEGEFDLDAETKDEEATEWLEDHDK